MLEEHFAADEARLQATHPRIARPEAFHVHVLAANQMRERAALRQACEGSTRGLASRFDERGMTDQRDALQTTLMIAASVEDVAIQRADDAVVAYEPGHEYRVERTRGEKSQNFFAVVCGQLADS